MIEIKTVLDIDQDSNRQKAEGRDERTAYGFLPAAFWLEFRPMLKPLRISENQPAFLSANDPVLLHLLQDSAQVFRRDGDRLGQLPLLQRQLESDFLSRLSRFYSFATPSSPLIATPFLGAMNGCSSVV